MKSMQESNKRSSVAAIEWLEYQNSRNPYPNTVIQHAYNHGEKKIGSHFVDGYLEIPQEDEEPYKIAFEFSGCEVGLFMVISYLIVNQLNEYVNSIQISIALNTT